MEHADGSFMDHLQCLADIIKTAAFPVVSHTNSLRERNPLDPTEVENGDKTGSPTELIGFPRKRTLLTIAQKIV